MTIPSFFDKMKKLKNLINRPWSLSRRATSYVALIEINSGLNPNSIHNNNNSSNNDNRNLSLGRVRVRSISSTSRNSETPTAVPNQYTQEPRPAEESLQQPLPRGHSRTRHFSEVSQTMPMRIRIVLARLITVGRPGKDGIWHN